MILWVLWDQWGRWQTFSSLETDCPKIQQLKTFTLLWFLWVRNSGEAQKCAFGWRSFTKLQSNCQLRLWSYLKTRLGEYAPKLIHIGLSTELPHASPKVNQLRVRASQLRYPKPTRFHLQDMWMKPFYPCNHGQASCGQQPLRQPCIMIPTSWYLHLCIILFQWVYTRLMTWF